MLFPRTPSIDAVIAVAKSAAKQHPYKQVRIVMYSPESGQSYFQKVRRGSMIELRDRGFYPLGLFGWYEKDPSLLQPVAYIFPWLQEDELAGEIFGMICDAEALRVKDLYEKRDRN